MNLIAFTRPRGLPALSLPRPRTALRLAGLACLAAGAAAAPDTAFAAAGFALDSLWSIAPAIVAGLLLSAAATASGVSAVIAPAFRGRPVRAVVLAALAGALVPVCGISVLPLVAAMLAAGVPLAAVMAFWLSSPVTDPGMFAVTAATLGFDFAVGKTAAAFAVGLYGGGVTAVVVGRGRLQVPLRDDWQRAAGGGCPAADRCGTAGRLAWRFWREPARRAQFARTFRDTALLMLKWLSLAFLAEYLMRHFLPEGWVSGLLSDTDILAVPAAALFGAPLYLEGHAALPLVRGMMDAGLPAGAAMALLVAGGITSAWAAVPVFALVRLPVFLLYLGLAVTGAMMAGWGAGALLP
ncbi:permease [Marinibaculum pumilum]|uniref:Permease n=1 Tax=Marinibaculum pumilum TaxID=1766165 RepID=A0ABV7L2J6_9PROT